MIKSKFFLIAGSLLLTMNLFAQDSNFHIYLCFGQSNMEGQGKILVPDKKVDDRFLVFQALDCSNLGRTKENWYPAKPPTCQCYSKLSPAVYFGRTMIANLPDSITVGVINVSVAGCDIRLFDKDIYQDYDSTYPESWFTSKVEAYDWNPYQYLIDLAQLAQKDGVIKGILLHQGETNTGQPLWPSYVKKIYNDMLSDLSLSADLVPLLAGEVLSAPGNCCSSMNKIINRLPDTIATSYIISSSGCNGMDNAHFDTEGYRILGRRYGVQMLSLMGYEAAYAEAECGIVGEDFYVLEDEDASNSTYITAIPGTENTLSPPEGDEGIVQMNFSLNADTTYYIYGRFYNSSTDNESLWIKIDDGDFEFHENLTTSGWEWLELKSIALTAGEHSISVAFAEDGAKLDKLVVKNSQRLPVDVGEEAGNLCKADLKTGDFELSMNGYSLKQNYPNPLKEKTTNITFEIPYTSYVSLKVFNFQGSEIMELAGKDFNSGEHTLSFDLEKLTPGIYFYSIKADNFSASKKMIVP